jgi:hypothetical protein
LKDHLGDQRVAMVSQDGFYNLWLTYLFPYQQIPAFNFTQMPRMAADYTAFLEAVGRNPLRLWQLSGVGLLLGPSAVEAQLPPGAFRKVLAYDLLPASEGNFAVQVRPAGRQAVFQALEPAPRYALIGGCVKLDDKAALARLSSNDWKLFDKIILPLETSADDPGGHGFCGTVEVVEQRAGRALLKVKAAAPGFLRCADKFDPDWKAWIDENPATVLRADYLFQGLEIPAGEHTVRLAYAPSRALLGLQLAGYAAALAAVAVLFFKRSPR